MAKKHFYKGKELNVQEILDLCSSKGFYTPHYRTMNKWLKSGLSIEEILDKTKYMSPPPYNSIKQILREERKRHREIIDTLREFKEIGDREDEFRKNKQYMEN